MAESFLKFHSHIMLVFTHHTPKSGLLAALLKQLTFYVFNALSLWIRLNAKIQLGLRLVTVNANFIFELAKAPLAYLPYYVVLIYICIFHSACFLVVYRFLRSLDLFS